LKHFIVPEAQHQIAARFESGSARGIRRAPFGMLPAIELNHQTGGFTAEVHDMAIDRNLTTDF